MTDEIYFSDLEKRISKEYRRIKEQKNKIKGKLDKNLGPYKNEMIDFTEDPNIKRLERELKFLDHKLKVYLRKREVSLVLKEFLQEPIFDYKNINKKDRELFGFGPFANISFALPPNLKFL